jgi:hypothetical protein
MDHNIQEEIESEFSNYLEILSNFTNKTLEWKLTDQKFSTLLVFTDLTENYTNLKFNTPKP